MSSCITCSTRQPPFQLTLKFPVIQSFSYFKCLHSSVFASFGRRIGLTLGLVGAKTGRVWRIYHFGELSSHCCPSWFQARFDAGELITQRELVSRQVSEDLTERAATFGLILDDVSLVRVLPFQFFFLECAQIWAVEERRLCLSVCSCMVCSSYHSSQYLWFCCWPSVTLSKPLKALLRWLIDRLHCCGAFVVKMKSKCFCGWWIRLHIALEKAAVPQAPWDTGRKC